jgi:hypothetical protein
MLSLMVEPTKSTPSVRFDPDAGLLDIRGESYPENAAAFYEPVLRNIGRWLQTSPSRRLRIVFELRYYNSSSSKAIMNLLDLTEASADNGWDIRVDWRVDEENEIIHESVQEFQEDYEALNIRLVSISTDE